MVRRTVIRNKNTWFLRRTVIKTRITHCEVIHISDCCKWGSHGSNSVTYFPTVIERIGNEALCCLNSSANMATSGDSLESWLSKYTLKLHFSLIKFPWKRHFCALSVVKAASVAVSEMYVQLCVWIVSCWQKKSLRHSCWLFARLSLALRGKSLFVVIELQKFFTWPNIN